MDEKSLLLAQVRFLLDQLDWAESSLGTSKVAPRIRDAAKLGFAVLFKQRRDELTRLQKSLSTTGANAYFSQQLHRHRSLCENLFEECRGFLGGAMLRNATKDNDVCDLADALLTGLSDKTRSAWPGVTLLVQEHFFTEVTGLIGLPFPDYGIWNLPIAVHELGHFIGPRIPDGMGNFPFQDLLQQNGSADTNGQSSSGRNHELSHRRELFSDLFAVYATGPAYACSCILIRFDPQDNAAREDGETHPSHSKRVHFMLRGLEEINKTIDGMPYQRIIATLRAFWESSMKLAGDEPGLDVSKIPALTSELLTLYPLLTKFVPSAQYGGWNRAVEMSREFPLALKPAAILKPTDEISDVLNAAWLWRLQQPVENLNILRQVNRDASALCREMIR